MNSRSRIWTATGAATRDHLTIALTDPPRQTSYLSERSEGHGARSVGTDFLKSRSAVRNMLQVSHMPDFHRQTGIPKVLSNEFTPARSKLARRNQYVSDGDPNELFAVWVRRLFNGGAAPKTIDAYRYQLLWILRSVARMCGRRYAIAELLTEPLVLGSALADACGWDGTLLSKSTLSQRRSAIKSFALLMGPEPRERLETDPRDRIDEALHSC